LGSGGKKCKRDLSLVTLNGEGAGRVTHAGNRKSEMLPNKGFKKKNGKEEQITWGGFKSGKRMGGQVEKKTDVGKVEVGGNGFWQGGRKQKRSSLNSENGGGQEAGHATTFRGLGYNGAGSGWTPGTAMNPGHQAGPDRRVGVCENWWGGAKNDSKSEEDASDSK